MSMTKDDRLAFILRKTIADFVSGEVKDERATVLEELLGLWDEHGVKQISVNLPEGEAVATITLSQPSPSTRIINDDEFIGWAEAHYPEAVETVTEKKVDPQLLKVIASEYAESGGRHYTAEGEEIPGVRTTTPAPSSFSVKYAKGDQSRHRVIEAWRSGELAQIDTGQTVPQLGGRP